MSDSLKGIFERCKEEKAVFATRLHPAPELALTFDDLLRQTGGDSDFESQLQACDRAEKLGSVPIVGVCGTINSGKSTIVSSFLSPQGRKRVLIGDLSSAGTHRFVFWLPAAWQAGGGELAHAATELIAQASGAVPEVLANDPAAAFEQYNAPHDRKRKFFIPLIAFDSALDEHGIAFLDCPDIQRSLDEESADFTASQRLAELKVIARVCSAFVVVASIQQAGSEAVGRLFQALDETAAATARRFLLNMTGQEEPKVYLHEAQEQLRRWRQPVDARLIYMARFERTERAGEKPAPSTMSLDEEARPLTRLGQELEKAQMQRELYRSNLANLQTYLNGVFQHGTRVFDEENSKVRELRGKLVAILTEKFLDDDGGLRGVWFEDVARKLGESFERTAPWGVQKLQVGIRYASQGVRKVVGYFRPGQQEPKAAASGEAFIDPSVLSLAIIGNRAVPPSTTQEQVERVWSAALEAAKTASHSIFDDSAELDRRTSQVWRALPFKDQLRVYGSLIVGMAGITGAGLLFFVDPSGISSTVWVKGHAILTAGQLLGALGGGIGIWKGLGAVQELEKALQSKIALPQLSRFYAALADGLGIPRYSEGAPTLVSPRDRTRKHTLELISESELPPRDAVVPVLAGPLLRMEREAWERLRVALEELKQQ